MRLLVCALMVLGGAAVLSAHHSGVMFDDKKEVTLKGSVSEFAFVNPHVTITITVTDDQGKKTDWMFEAASVQGLVKAGWRKSTLKAGDVVTLVGRPLRDGRPGAQLLRATLADGTTLKGSTGSPNY